MCGAYTFTLSLDSRGRLEDRQSGVTSLPRCTSPLYPPALAPPLHDSAKVSAAEVLSETLNKHRLSTQTPSQHLTFKMARVCVVLGSVREGRLGLRVARLLVAKLTSLGASPSLLDPLEVNPPLLQQPLHFMKVVLG